jgi:hypothetical protein
MESSFGERFDDVRVHDDTSAAEAAHHISAHAFTTGRDIYFGAGRYDPHSAGGQKLIAHELTHVLQQRRGAVAPGMKSLNASSHDDAFEREAELMESAFEKSAHSRQTSWRTSPGSSHKLSPTGEPSRLQRKCSCGGTCSKCSEAATEVVPQESRKTPLQRKARNIDERSSAQTQNTDPGNRTSSAKSIKRKCSCGGTCSKCAGQNASELQEQKKTQLQLKATDAPVRADTAKSAATVKETNHRPPFEEQTIQRKCGCGTSGSRPEEESRTPLIQRKADPIFDSLQDRLSPTAAKNENAARKNPQIGAAAKTASRPASKPAGKLAMPVPAANRAMPPTSAGHRAAPVQRAAGNSKSPSVTNDHFEREAEAASGEIVRGGQISSEKLSKLDHEAVQGDWEWCNPFTDPDCGVKSTAKVVADEAGDIAQEVWDSARGLARIVGGVLERIDNLLVVTIPPMHVCSPHSLQFSLGEISKDIPFLEGVIPVAEVLDIYGELGLHLGINPEISLQIGPCETHEIKIAIHPISMEASVSGGLDLTLALGLGAEARVGIYGEVGALITWPDPPIIVKVPALRIEAGLSGFVRGLIADHMSFDIATSAGLHGFSFSETRTDDIGLALDTGLAGYGALSLLDTNLCTLYFPFFQDHRETVLSLGFNLGLTVDDCGPSLRFQPDKPEFDLLDWDDLGIEIQRDMFKDDCPLCDFMRSLGLMPSMIGGPWPFHPTPPWAGPLPGVYPINPGDMLPKKAWHGGLCRGACGLDCTKCKDLGDVYVCEQVGDCHKIWKYPHFQVCPSADGCREHDACYDWCANKLYERGPLGVIFGPCHRMCDFECACDYGLPTCVDWIFGKGGTDIMKFSDEPQDGGGCHGKCPTTTTGLGGPPRKLCLEDITVISRRTLFHEAFRHSTGDITILSIPLEIPYIPPPTLDVFVRGEVGGSVDAGIGPVTLEGLCLIYDPTTHDYSGTGSVHLKGDLNGMLRLTGIVGAKAGWGCLLNAIDLEVIRGEAGLTATGTARAPLDLSATAKVSCRHGKLTLDVAALFKACLDLRFKLDAMLKVLLFKRFEIFSDTWNLIDRRWGHCWEVPLGVTSGEISSAGCALGTAAKALGLGTPAGPAPALTGPGATGPGAAAPAIAHAELGSADTLSIKSLVTDLFNLARGNEVVHDKTHGGLPTDPAKDAGKENPCGDVKPDDECGSKKLPLTHVSFFPGPLGQGGRVKASPLTRCPGNTEGSEPDNAIYKAQFDCINSHGDKGFWVRAHILHGETSSSGPRNLHGPGDDVRNLIIGDQSLNRTMRNGAEGPALDRVYDSGEALWYDSRVDSYVPGLDFFAESITINFGSFDTSTNTEGPRLGGGTFTRKRTPPPCPAGSGGLVVPPGALGGGATDNCADPLNIPEFDTTVDGRTRTIKTKDTKHTRMARKTLNRILDVAKQSPNCSDGSLSQCEQDFCNAVTRTDKKTFGGQIDSATRVDDVYKQLLKDAWLGKKPPSSGNWTEFGAGDDDVGFDMDSKVATNRYTVHTNVTTGGKVFTNTHLFPGDGD